MENQVNTCHFHPQYKSTAFCTNCLKRLCAGCSILMKGVSYCRGCVESFRSSQKLATADQFKYQDITHQSAKAKQKSFLPSLITRTIVILALFFAFKEADKRFNLIGQVKNIGQLKDNLAKDLKKMDVRESIKGSGPAIQLALIAHQIQLYYSIEGSYPHNFESFVREHFSSKTGADPMLDTWGNQYLFRNTEKGFEVLSRGSDGALDTQDDIVKSVIVEPAGEADPAFKDF